jgi:hypothetical protein
MSIAKMLFFQNSRGISARIKFAGIPYEEWWFIFAASTTRSATISTTVRHHNGDAV